MGTGEFILAVFKEINYLTHQEFKKLNEQISLLEQQPKILREKKKGDYLVENKMYVNAVKIYENALLKITRGWENSSVAAFITIWDALICICFSLRKQQNVF